MGKLSLKKKQSEASLVVVNKSYPFNSTALPGIAHLNDNSFGK